MLAIWRALLLMVLVGLLLLSCQWWLLLLLLSCQWLQLLLLLSSVCLFSSSGQL